VGLQIIFLEINNLFINQSIRPMAEEIQGSEMIRALYDQGIALKSQGNQVEALKKFDEV